MNMKKKIKLIVVVALLSSTLFSCAVLESVLGGLDTATGTATGTSSSSNIVAGLKEALRVGVDTATSRLAVSNGYFKDQAVKLLLPPSVGNSIAKFKSKSINILGVGEITGAKIYSTGIPLLGIKPLSSIEDKLILGLNRAAETAAKDAGPIFGNAIKGITIADGNNILFGGDNEAATKYLKSKTSLALFSQFEPKIDAALKSVKVGDKSVVALYENYVSSYNNILNKSVPTGLTGRSTIAQLMGVPVIKAENLSAYSTNKGLDGLFLKVAGEEKKIRTNPLNRVTSILKDVFGRLDK